MKICMLVQTNNNDPVVELTSAYEKLFLSSIKDKKKHAQSRWKKMQRNQLCETVDTFYVTLNSIDFSLPYNTQILLKLIKENSKISALIYRGILLGQADEDIDVGEQKGLEVEIFSEKIDADMQAEIEVMTAAAKQNLLEEFRQNRQFARKFFTDLAMHPDVNFDIESMLPMASINAGAAIGMLANKTLGKRVCRALQHRANKEIALDVLRNALNEDICTNHVNKYFLTLLNVQLENNLGSNRKTFIETISDSLSSQNTPSLQAIKTLWAQSKNPELIKLLEKHPDCAATICQKNKEFLQQLLQHPNSKVTFPVIQHMLENNPDVSDDLSRSIVLNNYFWEKLEKTPKLIEANKYFSARSTIDNQRTTIRKHVFDIIDANQPVSDEMAYIIANDKQLWQQFDPMQYRSFVKRWLHALFGAFTEQFEGEKEKLINAHPIFRDKFKAYPNIIQHVIKPKAILNEVKQDEAVDFEISRESRPYLPASTRLGVAVVGQANHVFIGKDADRKTYVLAAQSSQPVNTPAGMKRVALDGCQQLQTPSNTADNSIPTQDISTHSINGYQATPSTPCLSLPSSPDTISPTDSPSHVGKESTPCKSLPSSPDAIPLADNPSHVAKESTPCMSLPSSPQSPSILQEKLERDLQAASPGEDLQGASPVVLSSNGFFANSKKSKHKKSHNRQDRQDRQDTHSDSPASRRH